MCEAKQLLINETRHLNNISFAYYMCKLRILRNHKRKIRSIRKLIQSPKNELIYVLTIYKRKTFQLS